MEFVKRDVFELDHTSILVSKHKILLGIIAYVFAPSGRIFETHPYPGPAPTNCCFGGTEMKTVYVYRLRRVPLANQDRPGGLSDPAHVGVTIEWAVRRAPDKRREIPGIGGRGF